jgi:molybdenum cofactor synthesis domain-containing protein
VTETADEVTAALLIIGDEILSGRTQDINLQYVAQGLAQAGIRLKEVRVVADEEDAIVNAVRPLSAAYTYVFTTGGIGPTHDDITAASVAKAFNAPLLRDPRAVERLQRQIRPEDLNEARLRMANIPEGAALIDNPVSHAPGFRLGNVHVMAGVPRIMQAMFDGIKPGLKGGAVILSASVIIEAPEGLVATALAAIQAAAPDTAIGSYPFSRQGRFGTVIVTRGTDPARVAAIAAEVAAMARGLGASVEVGAVQEP